MLATQMQTDYQGNASQVIAFPVRDDAVPFGNNAEHLTALEEEARSLLRVTWLERGKGETSELPDAARAALDRLRNENRRREAASISSGIPLNFLDLCNRYKLSQIERDIVMMLTMRVTAPRFAELFKELEFDLGNRRSDGITAGTLLNLLATCFTEQLALRQCFSVEGALVREDLVIITEMDETDSILNQMVCLRERFVRFVIGDNNLYMSAFRYIRRETPVIRLEQVVLPSGMKEQVVTHLESFFNRSQEGDAGKLDDFYGYGTGLAMLFYGPSGAGKTMLAQALAAHCGCQLFSLRADQMNEINGFYQDILSNLFREAALQRGIVLLDEADDIFNDNSSASRALLMELEKSRCVVILATNKPVQMDPALERRLAIKLQFSLPAVDERIQIWRTLAPPGVRFESDALVEEFATRYRISGGIIKNCMLMAVSRAISINREQPMITRQLIDEILEVQTKRAFEHDGVCTIWEAPASIGLESLSKRNRESIKRAVKVYRRLQQDKLGLTVIITASDVSTARDAAALLAREANLAVREFDFERLISRSQADEMPHPVTQQKVPLIKYAFALAEEGGCATLTCDHLGLFDSALTSAAQSGSNQSYHLMDLQSELRRQGGLFILVSRTLNNKPPQEFNISISLTYPEPEHQVAIWKRVLAGEEIYEEDLWNIVETCPLHLLEIEYLARQARILSVLDNDEEKLTLQHLKAALERHGGRREMPLLFGEK